MKACFGKERKRVCQSKLIQINNFTMSTCECFISTFINNFHVPHNPVYYCHYSTQISIYLRTRLNSFVYLLILMLYFSLFTAEAELTVILMNLSYNLSELDSQGLRIKRLSGQLKPPRTLVCQIE